MSEIRYIHTDPDSGMWLEVYDGDISIDRPVQDPSRPNVLMEGLSIPIPTHFESTAALAEAVLKSVGNQTHSVIYRDTLTVNTNAAVMDMRERILDAVRDLLETHGTTDDLLNAFDELHFPLRPEEYAHQLHPAAPRTTGHTEES